MENNLRVQPIGARVVGDKVDPTVQNRRQPDDTRSVNLEERDQMTGAFVDAALSYALRGWSVLPLHSPLDGICSCGRESCEHIGKHPRTMRGLSDASSDPVTIRRWWQQWPTANIGVITGSESGLVVLDVDPRHGGDAALRILETQHGALPPTLEVLTGGGGRHYYFQYPIGMIIGNSSNKLARGLDVKGKRGYVVAPPSLHLSGRIYEWRTKGELIPEAAPDWLLAAIQTSSHVPMPRGGEKHLIIPEGQRNNMLASLAGSMRMRAWSEAAILAALLAENSSRCRPPLGDEEVKTIAKSIMRYPSQKSALENKPGGIDITWQPSNLETIVKQIQEIILSHPERQTEPVLSRGGQLVTVRKDIPKSVRQVKKSNEQSYPPMHLVKAYEPELLRMRIMRDVTFLNSKGSEIAMPDMAVRAFGQASIERAAPLVAIVEHPVITPESILLAGTGYDATTGLYLTIPPSIVRSLDGCIDWIDACCSLDWLRNQYLAEYPFASPCDRDAGIALSLTLMERVFIAGPNGYPAFSSTAPTQSSGKTTLFNQASHAVLGRAASATSWTSNEEEMSKTIIALLLEGQGFVLFDNLPEGDAFSSNEVAKLLTSEEYSGRLLGANRIVKAAANVFVGFTGNNITPADDFASRVLQIELKPNTENPDRRTFARPNIIEWTSDHRAEILFHCCVLVAAFLRSGDTMKVMPTRFPMWDRLVRYPILWAGGCDVADLFERNRMEDPHRQANAAFLSAWIKCFGSSYKQVKEVLDELEKNLENSQLIELRQAINCVLLEVTLTSQTLTGLLTRLNNKIIDGMRLEHASLDDNSRSNRRPRPWCVKRIG